MTCVPKWNEYDNVEKKMALMQSDRNQMLKTAAECERKHAASKF